MTAWIGFTLKTPWLSVNLCQSKNERRLVNQIRLPVLSVSKTVKVEWEVVGSVWQLLFYTEKNLLHYSVSHCRNLLHNAYIICQHGVLVLELSDMAPMTLSANNILNISFITIKRIKW